MYQNRSRLSRRTEEQTKGQIVKLSALLIVIILVLFFFGANIIGFIGNIVFKFQKNNNQTTQITSKSYLQPPFLDPLPQGTPSATITVSGTTQYKNGTVEIDVNSTAYNDISVDGDGTFQKTDVPLSAGNNTIQARVTVNNNSSDFSQSETIAYQKSAPTLNVSSPNDGQQFKNPDQNITISGTTDATDTVTVNGHVAVVNDDGSFSYYMQLQNGSNPIKVISTDQAGNTTEKDLTVNYQQ